jgi:histidine triad (HIT) family protein
MKYDDENIFAKILRGEIPSVKVFENEQVLVFMDIMPRSSGHLLVIPKSKARNILDINIDQLHAVIDTVQMMAKLVMKALKADGVTIQQFNEAPGGQEVFHLHFHVIPRYSGERMGPPGQMVKDMSVLADQAKKISKLLDQ